MCLQIFWSQMNGPHLEKTDDNFRMVVGELRRRGSGVSLWENAILPSSAKAVAHAECLYSQLLRANCPGWATETECLGATPRLFADANRRLLHVDQKSHNSRTSFDAPDVLPIEIRHAPHSFPPGLNFVALKQDSHHSRSKFARPTFASPLPGRSNVLPSCPLLLQAGRIASC